ncbi:ABC-F type ribosomal protection protein [Tissierella sp. MSJ-40]|uniref:ABC-F type ribosomal protection protein n=1 Tax=Tissierella simiarum TaxID=2841534 RepID=A0ABS6EC68_9FIRM|nr:ABC-F type ribosomal protection protein [Tissierella simiarum]MBU5440359.1 ABC-F type ribosomal protection protein [Tissierella simiarum]
MLRLNVNKVSKNIGALEILKDISFKVYTGDKIGIVGRNGCGKTTLIKMIIDESSPTYGTINCYSRIGYLPQDNNSMENSKVIEIIGSSRYDKDTNELINNFQLKDLMNKNMSQLSGGEKTKVLFVKALLNDPEFLILDEPTNHLDWYTIELMESYLNRFKGSILIISHDRHFLDNVVSNIYEIDNGKLNKYSGNYSFYNNQKKLEREKQLIEYEEYIKKKRSLELAARKTMDRANKYNNMSTNDFQRHKAAKIAKRSKAIVSRLNALENKNKPFKPKEINIKIDSILDKTGNILLKGNNISKSFEKPLFRNINFLIEKNSRIGIVGKNGSGKTTLLKIILGNEDFLGNLSLSSTTKIGYFSQELENLNTKNTVIDELAFISGDNSNVRNILGSMMFRGDSIYKKIASLSYGEKVRVSFSKLILEEHNLLILDEPTNFLDIPTQELIEEALLNYKGAILFVSHDRYFVEKMAKEIWELENQNLNIYLGEYDYYLDKKKNINKVHPKEEILSLEMKLSYLSFKLLDCSKEEKENLEKEYFEVSKKLNELKK